MSNGSVLSFAAKLTNVEDVLCVGTMRGRGHNMHAWQQHGLAELSADYCVSNTATQVRLRLQAACFDTYAGSWRLEERELTSQSPSSLRSY